VHVLCDQDREFDRRLLAGLSSDTEVAIRGPFGNFVLDDTSERPVLLIAEGPGFAPVKSLLQHALSLEHAPLITLFRVADEEGFFQDKLVKSYAAALDHFRYVPCTSDRPRAAILDEIAEEMSRTPPAGLSGVDVYVAGRDDFVAEARTRLVAAGLPEGQWKGAAYR
jgi:CDP-4-dehydro-6-deoxyglucose reductase